MLVTSTPRNMITEYKCSKTGARKILGACRVVLTAGGSLPCSKELGWLFSFCPGLCFKGPAPVGEGMEV